jgi:glyoxylase-like metal-dependent hydrolase (beta-lactamase superfamily II)
MKTATIHIVVAAFAALTVLVAAQQPDFSKVEIKTNKVSSNFYTLDGQGGTIGVLTGPDGVFMVDAQFAPLSDKIATAIKQIQPDGRIRLLVNTHVHGDHTGGNENFAKMGAIIMARPLLRDRLAKPAPPAGNAQPIPPAPAMALPVVTFDAPVTVHMNGEDVELIPIPSAHTDGDTMVRFPKADVIMTGDFFRSLGYPNIDLGNGGSLKGMLAGLNKIVELAGPNTKIIPGHGETVTKAAVAAHRDIIVAVRDKMTPLVRQGKSVQDVLATKPTADYDQKVPGAGNTAERFVNQLYAEIKAGKS